MASSAAASKPPPTSESDEKSGLASDLFKASDHASQYAKSRLVQSSPSRGLKRAGVLIVVVVVSNL